LSPDKDEKVFIFDNKNISFANDLIIDEANFENSNPNV